MSIEALVFLGIFFLLPLIERLLERNRRKRAPLPPPQRVPRTDADVDDVDRDPMLPAPPRRQPPAEPVPQRQAPPSRPIPPPPPVPIETRRPDPGRRSDSAQKRPKPKPKHVPQPTAARTMPEEVLQAIRMRERAQAQIQRTVAANVASTRAPRTATRALNRILRNPRSLRHAVLIAEVLGPCKAQDPRS